MTTQLIVNDTAFKAKKTDSIPTEFSSSILTTNLFKTFFSLSIFPSKRGKFHNVHVHYPPPQKKMIRKDAAYKKKKIPTRKKKR